MDGDSVTFFSQSDAGETSLKWSLHITQKDGERIPVRETQAGTACFSFRVSPNIFPLRAYYYTQMEFEGDSSVYLRGTVCLYRDNILVDSTYILFNVLPSRPIVKDAHINGTFDYKLQGYEPLATFTLQFTADRMERCSWVKVVADSVNTFVFPERYSCIFDRVPIRNTDYHLYEMKYQYADWGEFYFIMSENRYGAVLGRDTIYTTNYIDDTDILDFLDHLYMTADVMNISTSAPKITISNNIVYIADYTGTDIKTDVYLPNGQLVYKNHSDNKVHLSILPKGVYIIKIKLRDKTYTKKITIL